MESKVAGGALLMGALKKCAKYSDDYKDLQKQNLNCDTALIWLKGTLTFDGLAYDMFTLFPYRWNILKATS